MFLKLLQLFISLLNSSPLLILFRNLEKCGCNWHKIGRGYWELHSIVSQSIAPGAITRYSYHSGIIAIVRGRNYHHVRSLFHSLPTFRSCNPRLLQGLPSRARSEHWFHVWYSQIITRQQALTNLHHSLETMDVFDNLFTRDLSFIAGSSANLLNRIVLSLTVCLSYNQ